MPVLTLISDIGEQDICLAGAMMAFYTQHLPGESIIEITRYVNNGDIRQGAWIAYEAYRHFPKGTIHIAMIGLYGVPEARMLLVHKDGHYFIAPDNGFFCFAFGESLVQVKLWAHFKEPVSFRQWLEATRTAIIELQLNGDTIATSKTYEYYKVPKAMPPRILHNRVDCGILHVNSYGNIVLNITREQFLEFLNENSFSIRLPGMERINGKVIRYETNKISQNYNDVEYGELMCRFNSLGYMELAINHQSAAARFRSETFTDRNLLNELISIYIKR